MRIKYTILACLFISSTIVGQTVSKVGTTAAQFLKIGIGARALALGGAYSAIADDASALYWNPGGLSRIRKNQILLDHYDWILDVDLDFIGAIITTPYGNIGAAFSYLHMGEMEVTTTHSPEGTGEKFGAGSIMAQLSFARNLTDRFSIGGSTKIIQENIYNSRATGIAIDLGTANTLIWIKGQGIILNEPSIVARNVVNGDIIAVGNEAMEMVGRTHSGIETLRPLKDGVIADYKMTDAMILGFIRKIKLSRIARPRIVICIPSGVTDVEQRSVKESAEHANASEVYLIEEPMAAAIGIGIDVSKPVGNMIVDVGGGTTEIAVISLNGIGTIETIRIAGDEQTKAIIDWFKEQHKLGIGERTAENIKCTVGSAVRSTGTTIAVKGQDLITGIPKTMEVSSDEVRQALAETVFQITTAIKNALDKTPPEHSSDIIDFGIILTGGGALLKDLDVHIRSKTNLPVNVSEDPLLSVVKGTGIVLENLKKYQDVLIQP